MLIVTGTSFMTCNRELRVFAREGLVHQLRAGILRSKEATNTYLNRRKGSNYSRTEMTINKELSC